MCAHAPPTGMPVLKFQPVFEYCRTTSPSGRPVSLTSALSWRIARDRKKRPAPVRRSNSARWALRRQYYRVALRLGVKAVTPWSRSPCCKSPDSLAALKSEDEGFDAERCRMQTSVKGALRGIIRPFQGQCHTPFVKYSYGSRGFGDDNGKASRRHGDGGGRRMPSAIAAL